MFDTLFTSKVSRILFPAVFLFSSGEPTLSQEVRAAVEALEKVSVKMDLPKSEAGVEILGYVKLSPSFIVQNEKNDMKMSAQFDLSKASEFSRSALHAALPAPLATSDLKLAATGKSGTYSWSGELAGAFHGRAEVGVSNQVIRGILTISINKLISIQRAHGQPKDDDGRDIYIVEARDLSNQKDELPAIRNELENKPDSPAGDRTPQDQASECFPKQDIQEISVLVLFTEQARKQAGTVDDMNAEIGINISRAKDLFENSGNLKVSLKLAGTEEVKLTESVNDITGFKETLRNTMEKFQNKKADYKASVVSTIMSTGESTACGLGYELPSMNAKWKGAFNIVPRWCTNNENRNSMLHEIGHNLGLGHYSKTCQGSNEGVFDYSCGTVEPGKIVTLMGYPTHDTGRSLVLSSAKGKFGGHDTGDEWHDNARTLSETRCIAAGWK